MTKFLSPIVGAYHRPPASLVLANLPSGAKLILQEDFDNPYDSNAVRVMVDLDELIIDDVDEFDSKLADFGTSLEELADPFMIGFLAASGGKPLTKIKSQMSDTELTGNAPIAEAIRQGDELRVVLAFGPNGQPLASIETGEA